MDDHNDSFAGRDRERILATARDLIFKWVKVHFQSWLGKVDDQLFRMADKATSNLQQNRWFQAREEIARHRQLIGENYYQHVREAFGHFREHRDTSVDFSRADADKLRLIENESLEQDLAIADMSRKASANCSEHLYALNQRLTVLSGGTKVAELGNPASPGVFAEAIQHAIADLTLDSQSKLAAFKVYDSTVMERLPKLYELLNHRLQEQGLLPHLQYQAERAREVPEELAGQLAEPSLSKQRELLGLIQQLQQQMRASRPAPPPRLRVPMGELVTALQQLQQNSVDWLGESGVTPEQATRKAGFLREQIADRAAPADDLDADIVEVVGLLFEYMLNDEQLPDSVKALLSYLHTPFLKVALLDKEFFNHPEHPARQLLNSLVGAGERWVEPEGKNRSDVYIQMQTVVERVLREFNDDLRLFAELAFEFNHFLRQHARRIRLAEQRATEAARGEDRLKEIRERVDAFLRQKVEGRTLLPAARKLLFEPWASVLAFNLLRFGARSEQWQQAVETVDGLLRFDPPNAGAERRQFSDELEARLREGFETVGYDAAAGQKLIEQLRRERSEAAATSTAEELAPPPDTDIESIHVSAGGGPDRDPLLDELTSLEFGTWFVFNADRGKDAFRVKLAWYNSRTLHFMFVNRLGQQTAVMNGNELAGQIHAGTIRRLSTLDDKPFFEKALERVVEQLRGRRSTAH